MSSQDPILNLRPLHSGGHGDLFIGQLSSSGVWVVVKYLRESHIPHARSAFVNEVKILARGVKGIVRLLGSDTQAERPYYVMEYLSGGRLTRYAGLLSDEQLLPLVIHLARILGNFHSTVGTHGDFKPDNILLDGNGELKLADPLGSGSGLTVLFSQNHGGTPGYWAPEIRAGGPVSRAGDVYSFAATLYHLQTGRRPSDAQALDPRAQRLRCSPNIRETIMACSQADPKTRPTMQDVLQLLSGAKWADIQVQGQKVREALTFVGVAGGLALLLASLGE